MKNNKIGSTPLVKNNGLYYKLELFNPSGSIKDRAAYCILENYSKEGLFKKNRIVVVASSGNMGISFAYFTKKFNIKVIIVMPDNVSVERINILKKLGATVVLTPGILGMEKAIIRAKELSVQNNYLYIDQFNNIYNRLANKETGKEIFNDLPNVDYIVCGIGTGGTISGICEYLKENNKKVKVIGIEPYESAVISGGQKGEHQIQGIGAGFIPSLVDLKDIEVKKVKSTEVIEKFKNDNPLLLGLSSIACDLVAKKILEKESYAKIVIIAADGIDRYESMIL